MKKAYIFRYSQLISTNQQNSIAKFAQNTSLELKDIANIAIEEEKPNGIIYNYKIGKSDTPEFRRNLLSNITDKGGMSLSEEIFSNCWNAMCTIENQKLSYIATLQQQYKFNIHVIGRTNKLHHELITSELQKISPPLEISYTLSFEKHTLDNQILKQLAQENLPADHEVIWYYEEPEQDASVLLGKIYIESNSELSIT